MTWTGGVLQELPIRELEEEPGVLRQYVGNGGATIVDDNGEVVAEVPPSVEPAPLAEEIDASVVDSDWLD